MCYNKHPVISHQQQGKEQQHNMQFIDEGRTESHEQLFFACELGRADEGECGGRWNQLLCYP